ncbi:GNAT family N-acetyltransferase [Flavobacterium hauense]
MTKQSKAYWGYSVEQLETWSEALTITQNYIDTKSVYKLVVDGMIIGYYSFVYEDESNVRLDNLFVLPEYIGQGYGQLLLEDFTSKIKATNAKKMILHSDPNAESFYAKFGFIKTGQLETSIPDRFLPIMELNIEP